MSKPHMAHPGTAQGPAQAKKALAQALPPPSATAIVLTCNPDGGLQVKRAGKTVQAQLAYSCLVRPVTGDLVALWPSEDGDLYVTAVLMRRESAEPMKLVLPPSAEWSGRQIKIRADEFEVESTRMLFVFRSLEMMGELWRTTVGQVRALGGRLFTGYQTETHQCKQHFRKVEGMDSLDAEVIDHQARHLLHNRSENLMNTGSRLVKVQGAQIHMG